MFYSYRKNKRKTIESRNKSYSKNKRNRNKIHYFVCGISLINRYAHTYK